jgi:methylenetetrahydrofolate reductase (NADPH)
MNSGKANSGKTLIGDLIANKSGQPTFSCEFFPPKTEEGFATLWQTIETLAPFNPDFVSVTYGAGGSTQSTSRDITAKIVADFNIPTLAHLTCVGSTSEELSNIVKDYAKLGIHNILALRGDPVAGPGTKWISTPNGFDYASQLVELLNSLNDFSIGVAAFPEKHPESKSLEFDAQILLQKQKAGADFAITNLFFEASHYFKLVDLLREIGCTIPVIPGIMPVTSFNQIERFTALSGAVFPSDLRDQFRAIADDGDAIVELGVKAATNLCKELLAGGAPGIHMYTLNRSTSTQAVFENLGLQKG